MTAQRHNAASLARAIGTGRTTMHRYVTGERKPDTDTVHKIEGVLGVNLAHHLDYRSIFDAPTAAPSVSDAEARAGVEAALAADPGLSEESRRFLIGMYDRERQRSRP